MIKNLFTKDKYIKLNRGTKAAKPKVPLGMYVKCKKCGPSYI